MTTELSEIASEYHAHGVVGGTAVLTAAEADIHRSALEKAEAQIGSLHYIDGVDSSAAMLYPLEPGEASFHHGWTIHQSAPNLSNERRIGLNVQFLAPHNAHRDGGGTALLVRGEDRQMKDGFKTV